MEIIGLLGKAGVGKDYIARHILPKVLDSKNTIIMAFADQCKVNMMIQKNISYERMFIEKDFETRRLLQVEATEKGRNVLGEDIWIRHLDAWLKIYESRGIERCIITDVRFQNEAEWIRSKGGFILKIVAVDRNTERMQKESDGNENMCAEICSHQSEKEMDTIKVYDALIYNSKDMDSDSLINMFRGIQFFPKQNSTI